VTLTKSGPGLAGLVQIQRSLAQLRNAEVLVGIPAPKTQRKNQAITNASLLFILSKGSPLRRIPPRPVLEPSIMANKAIIAPHMVKAADAMVARRPDMALREMNLAGTVAANGAKKWFTDSRNHWPENAPSTLARLPKAKRAGKRPMIDTGQLRRNLTFVVRMGAQS
jgi:hypothetical protein